MADEGWCSSIDPAAGTLLSGLLLVSFTERSEVKVQGCAQSGAVRPGGVFLKITRSGNRRWDAHGPGLFRFYLLVLLDGFI